MKQWVILSGKGGTGKTTVAAALAHLAAQECEVVLADADVDAANLELLLAPTVIEVHDFAGGQRAVVDTTLCSACSRCAEVCRFAAVLPEDSAYRVEPTACEGCAGQENSGKLVTQVKQSARLGRTDWCRPAPGRRPTGHRLPGDRYCRRGRPGPAGG